MTLEPSQPTFFDGMELPLMSSRAASRAKTLALLENSAAWAKAPVPASGPRLSDLLASYDRNTSSWRTSQHCLLAQASGEADGLAEFSETWPSAGMMRNGKTFRRQPWALPIAESASGLWPTPTLPNGGRSVKHVTDWRSDRTAYHNGKKVQVDLRAAVNMWPTPRSCSAMAATITPESAWAPGRFPNLETVVGRSIWPTPTATMHKGSGPAALTRKDGKDRSNDRLDHKLQSLEGSGALNPTWVEWLMGFPTGHTDLQPSETPSCLPSQS